MTRSERITSLVVLGLLVMLPLITQDPYFLYVATGIFIWGVMATSLLLTIRVGIFNFGHVGFMSIGAYVSTLLVTKAGFSFWFTLPIAAVAAAITAMLIGIPTLRLKGMYFVLVSFMWMLVVSYLIASFPNYSGGWYGISDIPAPHLLMIDFSNKVAYYYLVLCFLVVAMFFLHRLWNSQIGKIYVAIRDNDSLSQSIGIPVTQYRAQSFIIASVFAALCGCFFAPLTAFIDPTMFTFHSAINVFLWMVIGGVYSIFGPLVGVAAAILIGEIFRFMLVLSPIVLGIIIIVIVLFLPEGIISAPQRVAKLLGKRK